MTEVMKTANRML